MSEINLQKKISIAKVFGKVNAATLAKAEEGKIVVMRVFGTASGVKTGVSDYGDWSALSGMFRAINPVTGETFDSGVCFLPDVALDLIVGQLNSGAASVDFAFDVLAALDESSAVGYSYRAVPIIQQENNPISRLEALISEKAPALLAPASVKGKK